MIPTLNLAIQKADIAQNYSFIKSFSFFKTRKTFCEILNCTFLIIEAKFPSCAADLNSFRAFKSRSVLKEREYCSVLSRFWKPDNSSVRIYSFGH